MPANRLQNAQSLRRHLSELTSRPKDDAHSMPSHFYTSEDFLDLETELLIVVFRVVAKVEFHFQRTGNDVAGAGS